MQQSHTATVHPLGRPPTRALPRKYAEPILYLADRMSGMGQAGSKERATLQHLAESAGLKDYGRQQWFRELNDQRACQRLDIESAKRGALVVLALLIKTDPQAADAHRAYFTKVRTLLGSEPITVPADVEEHRRMALGFLRD
jgi:hypothetical protein